LLFSAERKKESKMKQKSWPKKSNIAMPFASNIGEDIVVFIVPNGHKSGNKTSAKKKGEIQNDWKRIRKQSGNDYR
jgi:hypothetical protein